MIIIVKSAREDAKGKITRMPCLPLESRLVSLYIIQQGRRPVEEEDGE